MRALHAAKSLKKAGILARKSQSSEAFDWKSHTRKDVFRDSDWTYGAFSLTCPASMQIYWNKRKRLHKKGTQLPQDWFAWDTNMAAVTSCENAL